MMKETAKSEAAPMAAIRTALFMVYVLKFADAADSNCVTPRLVHRIGPYLSLLLFSVVLHKGRGRPCNLLQH